MEVPAIRKSTFFGRNSAEGTKTASFRQPPGPLEKTAAAIGEVLSRESMSAAKDGREPVINLGFLEKLAANIYVMNIGWAQLFAWMIPARDPDSTARSRLLARKMFMVLLLEQKYKHSLPEDLQSSLLLAMQKMLF